MADGSVDGPELLLEAVVRHAAQLNGATSAPVRRMRVQAGEVSVDVEWSARAQPGADRAPAPAVDVAPTPDDGTFALHCPAVGTFFRAPEPGAAPFVAVGDVVAAGQQVGIAEAMKLMNPIEADRAGRIVSVLVEDGESVEFGQPLFTLAPVE